MSKSTKKPRARKARNEAQKDRLDSAHMEAADVFRTNVQADLGPAICAVRLVSDRLLSIASVEVSECQQTLLLALKQFETIVDELDGASEVQS